MPGIPRLSHGLISSALGDVVALKTLTTINNSHDLFLKESAPEGARSTLDSSVEVHFYAVRVVKLCNAIDGSSVQLKRTQ